MSLYKFSDDSAVTGIRFIYADGHPVAALLSANKSISTDQTSAIRQAISSRGWSCAPVTVDGHDALQIGGFGGTDNIIDLLSANGYVAGKPAITQEPSGTVAPNQEAAGLIGKTGVFFGRYSLKIAGALNLIGDVMMHVGGYKKIMDKTITDPTLRKENRISGSFDLAGGGLYTLGGINSAVFGNSEIKNTDISTRTAEFIEQQQNPQAVTAGHGNKHGSIFHKHTANITLGTYTAGAALFLGKGMSDYRANLRKPDFNPSERKEALSLIAYGVSSLTFKILSLFIPENHKPEDAAQKKSRGPVSRVINWFLEKPLRIYGYGSLITDSFYGMHAYHTYQKVKGTGKAKSKSEYMLKMITTASYIASDLLFSISSKNPNVKKLTADEMRTLEAQVAESAAPLAPDKQAKLVEDASQFLTAQDEVTGHKDSVRTDIMKMVKNVAKNPWTVRTAQMETEPKSPTL